VRRAWEAMVSMRTTAVILAVLAALLLVEVLVPQQGTDPGRFAAAVKGGRLGEFLLVTLGLGNLSTSPVFLAALGLFFANLTAVLADRVGTTLRRVRLAPPPPAQAEALLGQPGAGPSPLSAGFDPGRPAAVLRGLGYRTVPLGRESLWGVRHRMALLGFPLFHLSFFVLCAGGTLLWYTRDVVTLVAAEGQVAESTAGNVVRRAPRGAPPPVALGVERVEVRLERGTPVALSATVRPVETLEPARTIEVNRPARWGDLSVLVERAGVAPVLWLVDERSYTLDRVAVVTASAQGLPTRVRIGPGQGYQAVVEPIPIGPGFPERDGLGRAPVALRVLWGESKLFDGTLRPGEQVDLGGRFLRLQEVRYWVGLRLVSERGGELLVAGFLLGVVGIVWRLSWYRREVVVSWSEGALRVGGRAEFFPTRFQAEAETIRELVMGGPPGPSGRPA